MGKYTPWCGDFDSHPLAAGMDNWTWLLDDAQRDKEYLEVLYYLLRKARLINDYCNNNKINGDVAAEYWLERFLWRADRVIPANYFSILAEEYK